MASRRTVLKSRGINLNRLSEKQRIFVEAYLADNAMNGANAARVAGYANPSKAASQLLGQKPIKLAIGKAVYERVNELKIEAKQVLQHLAACLYLDPLDLFEEVATEGGVATYRIKSLKEVPVEVRRCITKMRVKTKTIAGRGEDELPVTETFVEVELMSKDNALNLAMKHLGLVDVERPKEGAKVDASVLLKLLVEVEAKAQVVDSSFIEARVAGEAKQLLATSGIPSLDTVPSLSGLSNSPPLTIDGTAIKST